MAKTKLADGESNPFDRRTKKVGGPQEPKLLTESLIAEAALYIQEGSLMAMLAALLGVERITFYDWLRKGERERQRQQKWATAIEEGGKPTAAERAEDRRLRKVNALYCQLTTTVKSETAKRQMHNLKIIQEAAKDKRRLKEVWEVAQIEKDGSGPGVGLVHSQPILTKREKVLDRGDWRAAAYLLEKGDPEQFGQRSTLSIKSLGFDPADLPNMSHEELLDLRAAILGDNPDADEAAQLDAALGIGGGQ